MLPVSLKILQSWSDVFDTEYILNQNVVQIKAFELSFNLQYQPTPYIAWFSCNLQKFVADFRQITPKIANSWCSVLLGLLFLTNILHGHSFIHSLCTFFVWVWVWVWLFKGKCQMTFVRASYTSLAAGPL